MAETIIEGQLNPEERRLLTEAILSAPRKPKILIEVGTWLGGGSTLQTIRALERNGEGHLWGIEADRSVYERMLANIRAAAPEASARFTPVFGFSQDVIPEWLQERGPNVAVDFAFLDGANNPMEQIEEFELLDPHIPVGGQIMAHDAKMRKGKWLCPYLSLLDNWETRLHDVSDEGLFHGRKISPQPSAASLRAARRHLFKMRCQPAEVAATIFPPALCLFCLRLMPLSLRRLLAEGRK